MTKKKESKNVSKEKEDMGNDAYGYQPIPEAKPQPDPSIIATLGEKPKPKPNKKLETLYNNLGDKWNRLNKYLTQQGLGQNARQKVVEFVKEIRAIEDNIAHGKE